MFKRRILHLRRKRVLGWIAENSEPDRRIDIARHLMPMVKISECVELGSHLLFHAEVSTILRLRTQVCYCCAMRWAGSHPARLSGQMAVSAVPQAADRLAAASPSFGGSGGQLAVTGEAPVFQKRLVC